MFFSYPFVLAAATEISAAERRKEDIFRVIISVQRKIEEAGDWHRLARPPACVHRTTKEKKSVIIGLVFFPSASVLFYLLLVYPSASRKEQEEEEEYSTLSRRTSSMMVLLLLTRYLRHGRRRRIDLLPSTSSEQSLGVCPVISER